MAQKTLKFVMAIFAAFLFTGVVSALSITGHSPTIGLDQDSGYITVTVDSLDSSLQLHTYSDLSSVTFGTPVKTDNGATTTFNVSYNTNHNFDLFDDYSVNVWVTNDTASTSNQTFDFKTTTYCSGYENKGKLSLEVKDINVVSGFGEDDNYWYLRDELEVEVRVDNDGSWDVSDIGIEWELYTEDGKLIMDGDEDNFDLDRGDDNTITFTFKLDENMEDFEGNDAILYVRGIGQIDDNDADKYDGDDTCSSDKTSQIEVVTRDDFVIADDFEVNGRDAPNGIFEDTLACGSEVTINGRLWNIGKDRQDDVSLQVYSKDLGINKKFDYDRIREYDSEDFSFTFSIPKELDERSYQVQFSVYDEDGDIFENKEDDEAVTNLYLDVEGNCKVVAPSVSASLVEDSVVEGKTMTITSTITNLNDETTVYTLAASGFEDWAKLNSVKPEVVSIPAGQSKDVTFSFTVGDEAEGSRTFNINTYSNGEIVSTQPVSVNVGAGSFSVGKVVDKETLQIIGIVLLNLILIIAIIVVARRILRKK